MFLLMSRSRLADTVDNAGLGLLAARASLALVGAVEVLFADAGHEMAIVVRFVLLGDARMFLSVFAQLVSELHTLLQRLTDVVYYVRARNCTCSKSTSVFKGNSARVSASTAGNVSANIIQVLCGVKTVSSCNNSCIG